jgi:hypothetical protein
VAGLGLLGGPCGRGSPSGRSAARRTPTTCRSRRPAQVPSGARSLWGWRASVAGPRVSPPPGSFHDEENAREDLRRIPGDVPHGSVVVDVSDHVAHAVGGQQNRADHEPNVGAAIHGRQPTPAIDHASWGTAPAVVAAVGAVVTETGVTFSIGRSIRWLSRSGCAAPPAPGRPPCLDEIRQQSDRHALADLADPRPGDAGVCPSAGSAVRVHRRACLHRGHASADLGRLPDPGRMRRVSGPGHRLGFSGAGGACAIGATDRRCVVEPDRSGGVEDQTSTRRSRSRIRRGHRRSSGQGWRGRCPRTSRSRSVFARWRR